MYYPIAPGLCCEYCYCHLAIKAGAVKTNVAFVELPKGLIEGHTVCPVSCLLIKGTQALEVDVLGLFPHREERNEPNHRGSASTILFFTFHLPSRLNKPVIPAGRYKFSPW